MVELKGGVAEVLSVALEVGVTAGPPAATLSTAPPPPANTLSTAPSPTPASSSTASLQTPVISRLYC